MGLGDEDAARKVRRRTRVDDLLTPAEVAAFLEESQTIRRLTMEIRQARMRRGLRQPGSRGAHDAR